MVWFNPKTWFADGEPVQMTEAAGAYGDDQDKGWTKITEDQSRNLNPISQERQSKVAQKLWETNGLANRLVELPIAYMLADGVSYGHENDEFNDVIKRFINNPINEFDLKLEKRARELALMGELFLQAFVNETTGMVTLGYMDPLRVGKVIYDPDNAERPIGVITKADVAGKRYKYKVIVNGLDSECFREDTCALRERFDDGEIFYFAVNTVGIRPRGRSDLLPQFDDLDAYGDMLFGEFDRSEFLRAFAWHFKITGASQEEINNVYQPLYASPPQTGQTIVTNQNVEVNALSPKLGSGETEQLARLQRNNILGGKTVPEHVFGGGGDVNRSTGDSMMEPFEKVLEMRQKYLHYVIRQILIFVLRMHITKGRNLPEPDWDDEIYDLQVTMPEMTAKDTTRYASALQQMTSAFVVMIGKGMLTTDTAMRWIGTIANKMGVEFDAKSEIEAAQEAMKDAQSASNNDDVFTDGDAA